MGTYLEDNPPRTRQYHQPRRAKPTGLIVVHTAESALDMIGADTGAEDVARFIQLRTDFGSYHTIVDSDSRVRLVPFDAEAYGDRTGSNSFAIHISFACKAAGWADMSPVRVGAFIRQGAVAAAEAAKWLKNVHGVTVPSLRITKAQSDAGVPGFISHALRDPARRSDPGADFPWVAFLHEFDDIMDVRPPIRPTLEKITAAVKQAEVDGYDELADRLRKIRETAREHHAR